jgi:outer membrane protein OmpA-like peptidoglycan-associated protein
MQPNRTRPWMILVLVLFAGIGSASIAFADEHIRGVITGRANDATMMVQTDDSSTVSVMLRDFTKVRRSDGRKANLSALMPGLRVHVKGTYQSMNRLVAEKVEFSKSNLKTAQTIAGGVAPTERRSLANEKRIQENADLIQQQQQTLQRQAQQIGANKDQINANAEKIVATNGRLDVTNTRIGNLNDYNVLSTVTVYFRNGQAAIAPQYKTQLEQLASKAKGVDGYKVQVQGYASAVGSNTLNQKLSLQRADAVTAVLQQSGVPPTNIVVPAAMGISEQVASNTTKSGQAENRRTVVTLLQSKGIAVR